jgi:hypothetical protein
MKPNIYRRCKARVNVVTNTQKKPIKSKVRAGKEEEEDSNNSKVQQQEVIVRHPTEQNTTAAGENRSR